MATDNTKLNGISYSEMQYILTDPYGILALMNFHEQQMVEADSVGYSSDAHQKRYDELKLLGQQIIKEDIECFSWELVVIFGLNTPEVCKLFSGK